MTERPNACPHCGAYPCLPLWRKLTLGPSAHAQCRVCGFRVTVAPLQGWLALGVPWFILLLAFTHVMPFEPAVMLFAAAFVVCLVLYAAWVPLARWDISNERAVAQAVARRQAERERG